jgi:hypothetical protein
MKCYIEVLDNSNMKSAVSVTASGSTLSNATWGSRGVASNSGVINTLGFCGLIKVASNTGKINSDGSPVLVGVDERGTIRIMGSDLIIGNAIESDINVHGKVWLLGFNKNSKIIATKGIVSLGGGRGDLMIENIGDVAYDIQP